MSTLTVCSKEEIEQNKALKQGYVNGTVVTHEQRLRDLHEQDVYEQNLREQEKKSTYTDFAQLNRKNIAHIIAACNADKQAVRILLFIIEKMDKYNALICSYKVFEEQLEISKATITRAIKYLKEHGFISIYRSGTSNVYVINDDLAWTNSGDKHKYCKFPANVILTASEQTELKRNQKAPYNHVKIMEETNNEA